MKISLFEQVQVQSIFGFDLNIIVVLFSDEPDRFRWFRLRPGIVQSEYVRVRRRFIDFRRARFGNSLRDFRLYRFNFRDDWCWWWLGGRRRRTLFVSVALGQTFEVFNTSGFNGGTDEFVLALKSFGEDERVETRIDQIVIVRTLARQNRAADIDERQDQWCVESFIFRLDVVHHAVKFYVSVEAGDHNDYGKVTFAKWVKVALRIAGGSSPIEQ